jgi:hypothetical protein
MVVMPAGQALPGPAATSAGEESAEPARRNLFHLDNAQGPDLSRLVARRAPRAQAPAPQAADGELTALNLKLLSVPSEGLEFRAAMRAPPPEAQQPERRGRSPIRWLTGGSPLMRGPKEDDLLDEQLSHPVTDIAAAASSPDSDVSSPTGSPTGKRAGSWELAESGGARHVHQSTIPHPNLHQLHGEVLPVPVLLSHSPFAPLAKDLAAKDKDVLEKLSKAFVLMRFGRGDVLPSSPFYLVARGTVFVRVVSEEQPVATKCVRARRSTYWPRLALPLCPPVRSPRMPRAHCMPM